jgi:endonuclease YncB( thermonuclease family)
MSRRFRRRPPAWFWLALAIAAALAVRGLFQRSTVEPGIMPGEAVVSSVVDGRTLKVAQAGKPFAQVRLLGVQVADDAQARQWLAANLAGQTIRIQRDKRRRASDGAQLAYVNLGDTLVNAELIRLGFARHDPYPGDSESYARRLREAALK